MYSNAMIKALDAVSATPSNVIPFPVRPNVRQFLKDKLWVTNQYLAACRFLDEYREEFLITGSRSSRAMMVFWMAARDQFAKKLDEMGGAL